MNWMTACAALLLAAPALAAESTPTIKIDLGQPSAAAKTDTTFKTEDDKILYSLGVAVGQQIAQFKLKPAEVKLVVLGFKDVASGVKPKVELNEYGPKLNPWLQARHEEASKGAMAAEKKKAKSFVEKAVKEKGATVYPSGLIIIEKEAGTGEMPKSTDSIKAHYKGTTIDGAVFDSSYDRGAPTDFELNHVIKCWTEAFQKIKVGGKARLICPTEIAYGANPPPGAKFGPGATLIFDVELVAINKQP